MDPEDTSCASDTRQLTTDAAGLPRIDGRPLKLAPKERAALALLWRQRPGTVRKAAFADAAWGGGAMSDESLARCVSALRRALQPLGMGIEAVYGLGYRLVDRGGVPETSTPHSRGGEALAHARSLIQQRTPAAVSLAIELLRGLVQDAEPTPQARVAFAAALSIAVGWGQLPTSAAVEEALASIAPLAGDEPGLASVRGVLFDMSWRFGEARDCHERALSQTPGDADALQSFARHCLYTGAPERAVKLLRTVRRLAPFAPHPRLALSRALAQCGDTQAAVAEAREAVAQHPGQAVVLAFSLAMRALGAPEPELAAAALRMTEGVDVPPFAWTVSSYVLARLGQRGPALDIADAVLMCSATSAGEAALYAAPLAALQEFDRAAALLEVAADERCGMLSMILRDPAHAHWLPGHPKGRALMQRVFGAA